jgi:hypothetical protein
MTVMPLATSLIARTDRQDVSSIDAASNEEDTHARER